MCRALGSTQRARIHLGAPPAQRGRGAGMRREGSEGVWRRGGSGARGQGDAGRGGAKDWGSEDTGTRVRGCTEDGAAWSTGARRDRGDSPWDRGLGLL